MERGVQPQAAGSLGKALDLLALGPVFLMGIYGETWSNISNVIQL